QARWTAERCSSVQGLSLKIVTPRMAYAIWRLSMAFLAGWRLLRAGNRQRRLADGEVVVARKHQMQSFAVGAHPTGREAGRVAGAGVPFLGEIHRRPRAPRLRGVVDAEAALEAGVGLLALGPRNDLHPQVALHAGVVRDPGAVAPSLVGEDRAAGGDLLRPER